MAGGIDFNRGKFKELVLYLSLASEDDEGFGMVKLNKLLFRADFEAFRRLGHPITGETYEKQEFGPVARDLPIVLDELGAAGRLDWRRIPKGGKTRKVPTLREDELAKPDLNQFDDDERQVIEDTLRELGALGAGEARDWSHEQSAGWNVARKYGDEIRYATAYISTEPIPPEDLKEAGEYVRAQGWVT